VRRGINESFATNPFVAYNGRAFHTTFGGEAVDVAGAATVAVEPEPLGHEQRQRVDEGKPGAHGDKQGNGEAEVELRPSRAMHVVVLSLVLVLEAAWIGAIGYFAIRLI
jgi:hypothetical protein